MLVTVWKSCLQYKKMLGSAFLQRWAQLGDVLIRRTEPEGALPVPARDSSRARLGSRMLVSFHFWQH
jgi:hypothetical protein